MWFVLMAGSKILYLNTMISVLSFMDKIKMNKILNPPAAVSSNIPVFSRNEPREMLITCAHQLVSRAFDK